MPLIALATLPENSVYYDGLWHQGSGEHFTSYDPALSCVIWQAHAASIAQVDAAIISAHNARSLWANTPYAQRLNMLQCAMDSIAEHKDTLTQLIAREAGKTWADAAGESAATLGKLEHTIRAYEERTATHQQAITPQIQATLSHRPHGVMAVISPYNFPVHLMNGHVLPALLAGNTVVIKPSEHTPACAAWYVRQLAEHLPAGVINLVCGGAEIAKAIIAHPAIDAICFTGSYATGQAIHRALAGRVNVRLALEMGGNNPLIIMPDSPLDQTIELIIQSAYLSTGQRCTCARRLIVVGKQPNLKDALLARITELSIGDWQQEPSTFMACLIHAQAATSAIDGFAALRHAGGTILADCTPHTRGLPFITPALIDMSGCNAPDIELFAPILQYSSATTLEDAITQANNTQYGLAAGLVSPDSAHWHYAQQHMRAGILNYNRPTTGAVGFMPFGGIGASGNHAPGAYYAADYCAYPVASLTAEI